jgi:hypothetical protein
MAFIVKDRVQETSTTAGTGTFTLGGAVTGFKSFSVIGDGNSTYYAITTAGSEFEVGIGTYTASGTTLSRDTVLSSSNSNNLVDFAAGAKNVFVTYPAERSIYLNSGATAVTVGKNNTNTTITTDGTADLTLNTNSGTNSGTFTIADGINGNISITPNGTGSVILDGLKYPQTDGTANQVLKTDGSGNLAFTTLETGLAWQSVVTASTITAVANRGYFINTTSNACTVTLPASATRGDTIILVDYARTWGTNAVTINQNSLNFQGYSSPNPVYNTNGQSVTIVYSDATKGWIPTVDDVVTDEVPQPVYADFLVVAGGGGNQVSQGGNRESGSGAGGLRTSYGPSGGGGSAESKILFSAGTTYTCTVGAGAGGKGQGGASSISGTGITTITSTGGGSGANSDGDSGGAGGSGGGGWYTGGGGSGTANQGFNGDTGYTGSPYGGTGGGAGGVGGRDTSVGPGLAVSISGSAITYSTGGVSNNFPSTNRNANGADNTGNGAGGAANGGSGIVVLRLPTAQYTGITTGSPTVTTNGTDTVLTFTGTGTYTH